MIVQGERKDVRNLQECFHDGKLGVDKIVLHNVTRHRFQQIFVVLLAVNTDVAFNFHAMCVKAERQNGKQGGFATA